MKKVLAFTLAEVLITVAIIGVVAAMTLPTLKGNIEGKILSAKTKQVYALMSQATKTYMAQNGLYNLKSVRDCSVQACTAKTPSIQKMIETTLKTVQTCNNASECFPEQYSIGDHDFNPGTQYGSTGVNYVLADGYVIHLKRPSKDAMIQLVVDVNGDEPPNEFGRDAWTMRINNDGNIVAGSGSGDCSTNYDACFGEFLKNNYSIEN